eukprot:5058856-Amphidinium_carterae.1
MPISEEVSHSHPPQGQYVVYTDGSALWPQQKETRVAAWAWVAVNTQGTLVGWAKGLVPAWYLEASAHSGELHAVYQAVQMIPELSEVRVDCEAVVKGLHNPDSKRLRASKERRVWLAIRTLLAGRQLNVVKVPAHQKQPDKNSPSWLDWKGNHEADLMWLGPTPAEVLRSSAWPSGLPGQAAQMAQEDRQDYQWPEHWKKNKSDDRRQLVLSQSAGHARQQRQVMDPQVPDWIWELLAAARAQVPQLGLPKLPQLAGRAALHSSGANRERKAALRRVGLFHPTHQLVLLICPS